MKKYLFLANGKSPHIIKWINEISKYFEVFLISFNGIEKSVIDLIGSQRCIEYNKNISSNGGNYHYLYNILDIAKQIKYIQPDYINAHYITSYGLIATLIKKLIIKDLKIISSAWGTDILITPQKNFIYNYITKFILKNSDIITSDSFYMTDEILKIYKHHHILSFPFGLEANNLNNIQKENIIFSNRALYANYNIKDIVLWFSKYSPLDYKLIIANDGDLKDELRNLVDNLNLTNRISFVGFLNSMEQEYYYSIAKYYISIPISDSTSVSLLEAMSYGCIPILSNIPANREWIIDKFNGLFFHDFLKLETFSTDTDIVTINQNIINQRAIFKDNIKYYICQLGKI